MASNHYDSQASTNYKEAFSLFDKRGNGRVTVDSLGDLLRACGQNPTLAEIKDLEKQVGGECEFSLPNCQEVYQLTMMPLAVDFETFQRVLNRPGGFRDPGDPEEYCRGFQVFDKDMSGFIGVGQLKYILTNLGEKMSEDEVDELLKTVDTSSGQVNYTGGFNPRRQTIVHWLTAWDVQSWCGQFLRTEVSRCGIGVYYTLRVAGHGCVFVEIPA